MKALSLSSSRVGEYSGGRVDDKWKMEWVDGGFKKQKKEGESMVYTETLGHWMG